MQKIYFFSKKFKFDFVFLLILFGLLAFISQKDLGFVKISYIYDYLAKSIDPELIYIYLQKDIYIRPIIGTFFCIWTALLIFRVFKYIKKLFYSSAVIAGRGMEKGILSVVNSYKFNNEKAANKFVLGIIAAAIWTSNGDLMLAVLTIYLLKYVNTTKTGESQKDTKIHKLLITILFCLATGLVYVTKK